MKVDKAIMDLVDGDTDVKYAASELASDTGYFYPFGCPVVDIPFGGGISSGKIYEFLGPPSAGKSTFALEMTKAFAAFWNSRKDENYAVLWIESESSLDKYRAVYMGCPMDKFIIKETDVLEVGHDFIKNYLERSAVKGMKLLIVWDTIAAVSTKNEKDFMSKGIIDDSDDEDKKKVKNHGGMIEKPRLIKRMLRDITQLLGETNSVLVFVNQVVTQINTPGNPLDSSGGNALKHHASIRGMVSVDSADYIREVKPNGEQIIRAIVPSIDFRKNKITGFVKYKIPVYLDLINGADFIETRLRFLKNKKIISMAGAGWTTIKLPAGYAPKGKALVPEMIDIKFQNAAGLNKLIEQHVHLVDWLDYLIYRFFAENFPLVKVKNIGTVWEYETKFFGEKKTVLTEREVKVAALMSETLTAEDSDEEEAKETKKKDKKKA